MAVTIDSIDENAANFLRKYDHIPLPDSSKMFITKDIISKLF
ncbi:hypothetical protein [Ilyomonas limi]|nr:hypothetical protein [Ilyomonas limi]